MKVKNKTAGRLQLKQSVMMILISSLLFSACAENPEEFTLGEKFIESQTDLSLIDTFTVSLSTVILDTVTTSGTETLLIGCYSDDTFGKITSSSYFQIGIPSSLDVLDDDIYDSLKLVIRYNNYSFGDTTKSQKFTVHQLTENIVLNDDDVITTGTTFAYNTDPIGSILYTPEPNATMDTLFIKISDDIGRDFFEKLRDDSEILIGNETFINYFHGLVLKADENYEGSIIGFQDDVELVLYTSREDISTAQITYEFELNDVTKQFNNIAHDLSSTQLNALVEQRYDLSSTETEGLTYLQGGIGLAIRVNFPSLREILLRDRGTIVEAQLSIAPLNNSYNEFELPSDLYAYTSDKINRQNNATAASTLTIDELYNEETAYVFDITSYLNTELADSYTDSENGLLITLPPNELSTSFNRLIIDAQNKNTKLKIYYLSY